MLWDFLPTNLSDIKQIEVIRGPASAVWGANAETGVVNIVTKSPREAPGTTASLSGGIFVRDAGSTAGKGPGALFGSNASMSRIVNDRWSYRLSAGYFASDALPRPTGTIPLIPDPRDPSATVGGATYPDDGDGPTGTAFKNTGTSQPKFDARVDQELGDGRVSYGGGIAGSNGIIHTGIGPFDIQKGSYQGYGRVGYNKGALKLNFFTNFIDAEAPNLLLAGPGGTPLQLNFSTQTYDFEAGDAFPLGQHHVLSVGGNVRRNNFNITIDPNAENRTELGAYVQDEIFADRFRFTLGGRVDKFGNLQRSGLFPAARGDVQADGGPGRALFVQSRVSLAIGDQQLPRHRHRRSHGPERACAAAAAALAPLVATPVSADGPRGRQPPADRHDPAGGARRGIAHGVRNRLRRDRWTHQVRRGVFRQRYRRPDQLLAASAESGSLYGGQSAAGMAAAAVRS